MPKQRLQDGHNMEQEHAKMGEAELRTGVQGASSSYCLQGGQNADDMAEHDHSMSHLKHSAERNVVLLVAHEPQRDPRCAWFANAAPPGVLIHQLGISRVADDAASCISDIRGQMTWIYPRIETDSRIGLIQQLLSSNAHSVGMSELLALYSVSQMSDKCLARVMGVSADHPRLPQISWSLAYIVNISLTIVHHATALRGIHAVIACDLDTLPAAVILKELYGIPVIYDAHEFWAEADVDQDEFERKFWLALERRLLASVDSAQTVSSTLASFMSELHGVKFFCVPNAEPIGSAIAEEDLRKPECSATTDCHFLFQGGFAKARGIDLLIKAWPDTNPRAILELRGPDNPYKLEMISLAESVGLLGTRIIFLPPVAEHELVKSAAASHVGIIPYTPTGINYGNCCPNKLSQYMAAGLPVLANRTAFISEIINDAACGDVVDFEDRASLVGAINRMTDDVARRSKQGLRAYSHFLRLFHWEVVSKNFYARLLKLVAAKPAARLQIEQDESLVFHGLLPSGVKSDGVLRNRSWRNWRLARGAWQLIPLRIRLKLLPFARRQLKALGYSI